METHVGKVLGFWGVHSKSMNVSFPFLEARDLGSPRFVVSSCKGPRLPWQQLLRPLLQVEYYDYELANTSDRLTAHRDVPNRCWRMKKKLPHQSLSGVWVPAWAVMRLAHVVHDCGLCGWCKPEKDPSSQAYVMHHRGDLSQVLLSRYALLYGSFPE
jgi:hypothetical protein